MATEQIRWTERLDGVRQDLRYSIRTLAKYPTFTLVAVLTLAIGIGANSAIFSVVNGVMLKPLPFPHPERLLRVWQVENVAGTPVKGTASAVNLDDWRARRHVIADMGGYFYSEGMSGTDLMGIGEPQLLSTTYVTPGFWNTFALPPELGRVPRDDEMVRGSNDRLLVLSHAFWQREFGGDRSVIGRRVTLGADSYEIVGVMPPSFHFPSPRVEVYIPYSTIPDNMIPRLRGVRILQVVARLTPGATVTQADAELNGITRGLSEEYPEDRHLGAAAVAPLQGAMIGDVRPALLVLLGAVGFVLLITIANLAGLLLARAATRERELAIRVALGAERSRLVRQLVTESLVLSGLGGALGLVVAALGSKLLLHLAAGQLARAEEVALDYRVVAFTVAISVLAGVAFGLVPSIRASSPELQESLREGTRGSTAGAGPLRSVLVAAEVALAVVLVAGAGLMTRSFMKLLHVDLGFAPEDRVAVTLTISEDRHPNQAAVDTYRAMLDKVRSVPGVVAAGAIRDLPFHGDGEPLVFVPPGFTPGPNGQLPHATLMFASDDFFQTMGIPLLAGRDLSAQDRNGAPIALIVNEALAKRYFPDRSPVGQTITFGDTNHFAIVGVVGDARQNAVNEAPVPRVYASAYQIFRVKTSLVVRMRHGSDAGAMIARVEGAIRSVDPQQTFISAYTMPDAVGEAVAQPRLLTVLLGIFGAMGLALGALGLYGVLANLVSQRTREIGVRLALGAPTSDVLGMVVGRGLRLAAVGLVVGLAGALVLTRLMRGVLYGVTATDPLTFGIVIMVLLAVAAIASWLPARRATKVDPLVALRYE